MISAGERSTRITFERKDETPDGGGGRDVVWAAAFARWAKFAAHSQSAGAEGESGGVIVSHLSASAWIIEDSETRQITESWRAKINGQTWNIRAVVPSTKDAKMLRLTLERAPA